MIIPLLAFLGAVVLAIYFAFRWDAEDRKAIQIKHSSTSPTLWSVLVLPLLPCLGRPSRQVAPQHAQIEMTSMDSKNASKVALSTEEEAFYKDQKRRERKAFQDRKKSKSVGSEHSTLDDALPVVYRNNTYIEKITTELTRHHRYFGIVYYYSSVYPRALRVLSLGSNILTTLYFIALTYTLHADDNTCSAYSTKSDCLVPKSHWHTGQDQCMWDNNEERCRFIQPSILIRVILFAVVFAVMLSIPVNMVMNYLIQYVLAAPLLYTNNTSVSSNKYGVVEGSGSGDSSIPVYTGGDGDIENNSSSNEDLQALQIVKHKPYTTPAADSPPDSPVHSTHPTTHPTHNIALTTHTTTALDSPTSTTPLLHKYKTRRDNAHRDLDALLKEVRHHRELYVKGIIERRTFDRAWGLTPAGQFITTPIPKHTAPCTTRLKYHLHHFALHYTPLGYTPCVVDDSSVRPHVYGDILRTQRAEKVSLEAINALFTPTTEPKSEAFVSSQVGKVVLLNLYVDLLPPTAGLILQCKSSRDSILVRPVWSVYKLLAWCVVVAVNAYFVYSLFMYAGSQSSPRTTAWFKSFMLFIALDCAGLATNSVVSSHVLIPALVMHEVNRVKEWLMSKVQKYETEQAKLALTCVQLNVAQAPLVPQLFAPLALPTDIECSSNATTSATFNAAVYLYTSYRLCRHYPTLPEANIVRVCTLQVPRQAHLIEVKESESVYRVCNLCSVCSVVLYVCYVCILPCVHIAMLLPLSIQDAILDYITIALFGYILLLHMELYTFYPPLAFVPPFVALVLLHFYVVSSNGETNARLNTLKKQTLAARTEQRKINNRIVVVESRGDSGGGGTNTNATPYNTDTTITGSSVVRSSITVQAGTKAPSTFTNTTNTTNSTNITSTNAIPNTTTTTHQPPSSNLPTHALHKTNTSHSMYSVGSVGSSVHHPHSPSNNTMHHTHHTNTSSNSPTGTESRLKQFLSSADKVLEQQEQHSPYKSGASGVGGSSSRSHSPVNTNGSAANLHADIITTNTTHKQPLVDEKHYLNSSTTTVGTSFNTLNSSAYNATTTGTNNANTMHSPQQQHSWSNLKTVESFVVPHDTNTNINTTTTTTTITNSSGIAGLNSSAGTIATVATNNTTGSINANTTTITTTHANNTNISGSSGTSVSSSSIDSPSKGKRLVKKASRPAMSSGSGGIGTITAIV